MSKGVGAATILVPDAFKENMAVKEVYEAEMVEWGI